MGAEQVGSRGLRLSLRVPRRFTGYIFIAPTILYLLIASIYPLERTFQMSFTDVSSGEWRFVGLRQYEHLLADPWFWNGLRGSAIFTVASTTLHLLIGLWFALLLNERWFSTALRNFARGLLIFPWLFSTVASALAWSLLYHPFGFLNYLFALLFHLGPISFLGTPGLSLASVIAVNVWKFYPFYMIAILGALQSIPVDLYEAARVDGANARQRLRYITLPHLKATLVALGAIDCVTSFGHVDFVLLLTSGGPLRTSETEAFYIFKTALLDGNLSYGAAISCVMLVVLIVFVAVYLRTTGRGSTADEAAF